MSWGNRSVSPGGLGEVSRLNQMKIEHPVALYIIYIILWAYESAVGIRLCSASYRKHSFRFYESVQLTIAALYSNIHFWIRVLSTSNFMGLAAPGYVAHRLSLYPCLAGQCQPCHITNTNILSYISHSFNGLSVCLSLSLSVSLSRCLAVCPQTFWHIIIKRDSDIYLFVYSFVGQRLHN